MASIGENIYLVSSTQQFFKSLRRDNENTWTINERQKQKKIADLEKNNIYIKINECLSK